MLDVGCGTGENALYLAQNGFSVVGVDLSTHAIAAAKAKGKERKLRIDFRLVNALSLELESGLFDNAIDSGLFHTFTDHERVSFAAEIARVLTIDRGYFMLCFSDKEPSDGADHGELPRKKSKERSLRFLISTIYGTHTSPLESTTTVGELILRRQRKNPIYLAQWSKNSLRKVVLLVFFLSHLFLY